MLNHLPSALNGFHVELSAYSSSPANIFCGILEQNFFLLFWKMRNVGNLSCDRVSLSLMAGNKVRAERFNEDYQQPPPFK